jgi:FXSXX-COOH protein
MGDQSNEYFGHILIDVSGLSLRDLDGIGDSSISHALREVLADDEIGPSAGFTSSV